MNFRCTRCSLPNNKERDAMFLTAEFWSNFLLGFSVGALSFFVRVLMMLSKNAQRNACKRNHPAFSRVRFVDVVR